MQNKKNESLGPVPLQIDQITEEHLGSCAHDAVFGQITEDGPNYRSVCYLDSPDIRLFHRLANANFRWDGWGQLF